MGTQLDHTQRGHSELGASSSHRWMTCTASYDFIKKLREEGKIKETSSKYADEGTAAHELSEHCIMEGKNPEDCIGMTFNEIEVTEEMANAVKVYVDYIRKQAGKHREVLVEEEFSLAYIDEEMFGTNDCCILDDLIGELEIVDYKHGMGVEVEVENNPQLLYYALGAYKKYGLEGMLTKLTLTVVQPRLGTGRKHIKSWVIDEERLLKFESEITQIVKNIRNGKVEWVEGEHCRFCPAKAHCPVWRKKTMEIAKKAFAEDIKAVDLTPPESLTDEQLQNILKNADLIKKYLDSVTIYAQNELISGKSIYGFKLVEKRTLRRWKDEDQVIETLKDKYGEEIFVKKLKGITDMQKLIGKKLVDQLAFKPAGEPIIAPESDKRPALSGQNVKDLLLNDIQEIEDPEF